MAYTPRGSRVFVRRGVSLKFERHVWFVPADACVESLQLWYNKIKAAFWVSPPSSQTNVFSVVILALVAEISPSANKITGHWLCSVSACCDTSLSRWLYFLRECNVEPKDFKAIKWGFIIQKAFKIFCFCWLSLRSVVVFQMLFRGIGTTSVSVAALFLHWQHFNPIPALGFGEWFIARTHSAPQPFLCDLPLLVACEVSCCHCFFFLLLWILELDRRLDNLFSSQCVRLFYTSVAHLLSAFHRLRAMIFRAAIDSHLDDSLFNDCEWWVVWGQDRELSREWNVSNKVCGFSVNGGLSTQNQSVSQRPLMAFYEIIILI